MASNEPRTWELRNPTTKAEITITLTYDDVMLTVRATQPNGPDRRDERKLKDYGGALAYIQKFIVEREVRGFKLVRDSLAEKWRAEHQAKLAAEAAAAAAAPKIDPRVARVLASGAQRDGWATLSCERTMADDVVDAVVHDGITTVQLVCDGGDGEDDDDDDNRSVPPSVRCLRQVMMKPRPALRALVLDTYWQTLVRQVDGTYGNRWGDLGVALNAQPQLEHVYAAGLFGMTPLRLDHLTRLTLISSDLTAALEGLRHSALPALTHLGIAGSLEVELSDQEMDALTAVLQSAALPALTQLDVDGAPDPVDVLEAAATRSLKVVCVAGALDDEDVVGPRLARLAPSYAHAEVHLALDTFSEDALTALQTQWPTLHDSDNHGLFLPSRYQ